MFELDSLIYEIRAVAESIAYDGCDVIGNAAVTEFYNKRTALRTVIEWMNKTQLTRERAFLVVYKSDWSKA